MSATSRFLVLGSLAAAVSACSVKEARISVSSDLEANVDRLQVTGMGGGGGGKFRLAGTPGVFRRGADRIGFMDPLFVRYVGGGRFDLQASDVTPAISARCAYGEGRVNVGPVSVAHRPLSYMCEIATDGEPNGRLLIHDTGGTLGSVNGRSEREGTFEYRGQRLVVRSIHRMIGSPLPVQAPLGYMFLADGRQVGAVDLNGPDKTILAPRSPEFRQAVIAAGLSLSIFWDPADVQRDY